MRVNIFAEIEGERRYQDEKWGHTFDDTHSPADWWTFATFYYTRALQSWKINPLDPFTYDRAKLRAGLIKVAAIIVAWIETLDRTA